MKGQWDSKVIKAWSVGQQSLSMDSCKRAGPKNSHLYGQLLIKTGDHTNQPIID